jgi:2-polyprenyl-3-methyl-5-hydroxy-6-metoxy-1,4-benzoquinol methylase
MAQWFKKNRNDSGFRSLEEQMLGLKKALGMAKGKSVLDLGCAEGLISKEFLKAGAASLTGIEMIKDYVAAARIECKRFTAAKFIHANLIDYITNGNKEKFDVVLALAIIHKAPDPNDFLNLAIDSCNPGGLIIIRYPVLQGDGLVKSKFNSKICNVIQIMTDRGFISDGKFDGPRNEVVEYWTNVIT